MGLKRGLKKGFVGIRASSIPVGKDVGRKVAPVVIDRVDLKSNIPVPKPTNSFGTFKTEQEFEQTIIIPLLQSWHFHYNAQYPCLFHLGARAHRGRIDFYVRDDYGDLTLFENKVQIGSTTALREACSQARSYALMHGLASFVVAAPEGMWVYSLHKEKEQLEKFFSATEIQKNNQEMKELLLNLRGWLIDPTI